MAQVRKYKPGGIVKADGGLKYDDNVWSGAEFINNFRQWGQNKYRNDYDKLMVFGKIIDAIEGGEQFTYDSDKLMLSPSNPTSEFELSDNKRISNKLKKAPTWWERNFPTNRDAYRTVIADLRNYSYNVPEEAPKAKEKVDWSDNVTYYITSDTTKYPIGAGINNKAIGRLTDIINGRNNEKEYTLYGTLDTTTYDNAKEGGETNSKYKAILNKLKSNQNLSLQDIADLQTFGILVKDIAEKTADPLNKPEVKEKPISTNLKSLIDAGVITGNDIDGYAASQELIARYGNAAMFNDNWRNSDPHYVSSLDSLYGYTLLNGKLYKTDTWKTKGTPLYQYIAQQGILDKIKNGDFEDANKALNYQWGNADYELMRYDPYTYFLGVDLNRNDEFIDWSQWDDTYRYITGNVGDTSDTIFKYWYRDLYNPSDPWSIRFKYSSDIDPKYFVQAPIDYYTRIKAPGTQYDGKVAVRSSDPNDDTKPAFTYYYDPTDSNSNMIFQFHYPELAAKLNNKAIVIPANIARELLATDGNGVSFLNQKNWPYQKLKEFANILMSKVATGWSDVIHDTPEKDDYTKWGAANGSLLEQLFNNWVKRNGQGAESRQNKFLIDPYQHPPMHKNGGVIQSFQPGGYMLPSLNIVVEDTPKQKDVADIIDPSSKFTTQDWWDVINLGADVGALITSLVPGGNPLSSGIGALSTISQTAANISRDGLDLDDAVNLITGLGFDAVSLVPGIGTGAKIGKLTKMVTNIAPILTTGFGLLQLPQSVTAVHNIVNGNSTMEDWRDLLYGIQALRGIRKSKKMIKETRVSNPKTVEALPEGANWGQRTAHKAKEKSAAAQNHWKGMLMKNREFVIPENATTKDIIDMYRYSDGRTRSGRTGRAKVIYEISPAAKSQIDNAEITFKRGYDDYDFFPSWHATESKKKGGIIKARDGWKGFWKAAKDSVNNLDLLNLTELGTTIAGNAMIANAQKKQVDAAWKADLKTYTPKSTPIYNQSVLDAGYVDRKNQINNTTFTHSDPRYNLSFQFQKLKSRNDLDREYWSNVARFNSEYNNNLIETNWQNRTLAQQVADNNRAAFYQGQAAKHEVDAQHWNNQFKTVANYFTQLRANRDKKLAYDRDLYTKMYTTQYQQKLNDAQTTLNNAWTAASKSNDKLTYTDWINGIGKDVYKTYNTNVKRISNDYYTNLGSLTNKRKLWNDPTFK